MHKNTVTQLLFAVESMDVVTTLTIPDSGQQKNRQVVSCLCATHSVPLLNVSLQSILIFKLINLGRKFLKMPLKKLNRTKIMSMYLLIAREPLRVECCLIKVHPHPQSHQGKTAHFNAFWGKKSHVIEKQTMVHLRTSKLPSR